MSLHSSTIQDTVVTPPESTTHHTDPDPEPTSTSPTTTASGSPSLISMRDESKPTSVHFAGAPAHISAGLPSCQHELIVDMEHDIAAAGRHLHQTIDAYPINEPADPAHRKTTVSIELLSTEGSPPPLALSSGWRPDAVYHYGSIDPWQICNPERTRAMQYLVDTVVEHAHIGHRYKEWELAYGQDDSGRSRSGRKATALTKAIIAIDGCLGEWVKGVPRAESLRPIASPWSDTQIITRDGDRGFSYVTMSPAMLALAGGLGDSRGVRERAAWESLMLMRMQDTLRQYVERDDALILTSLGTGTGEPIMDTGIDLMSAMCGDSASRIIVNGFDLDADSLAVATHLAETKSAGLPGDLVFNPGLVNILDRDGISTTVAGTNAHIYEAIGFAEYVPSDHATSECESKQRAIHRRLGRLSAEEFFQAIYEDMPLGSVFLTGNMRKDRPNDPFVIDGLGWPGIIERGTEEFLTILERARIPGAAVQLFLPKRETSSGVYNLVAITKLAAVKAADSRESQRPVS
jgi:hypothetical protein